MKFLHLQGAEIPALGLGTYKMHGEECRRAVEHALSLGYRHIDTAEMYDNHEAVRQGLQKSAVPRDQIFLTTKIWYTNLDYESARRSIDRSLRELGVDYVDLMLIHWPGEAPLHETLEAMAEARDAGKIRHLGVSNFTTGLVEEALQYERLLCNQVEYHPFLDQQHLVDQVRAQEMMLTAYAPIARGAVMEEHLLIELAEKYDKTPIQVTLRWFMEQDNVCAIPKAASAEHRESNLDIFDFQLSADEVQEIGALHRGERLINPAQAPNWER